MIKKKRKLRTFFFYGFVMVVVVLSLTTTLLKPTKIPGSFRNSGYMGCSLFSDVLKSLGYQVDYTLKTIQESQAEGLLLLNLGANTDILYSTEQDYIGMIEDYAVDGGAILVLYDAYYSELPLNPQMDRPEAVSDFLYQAPFDIWHFKSGGTLLTMDLNQLSNTMISVKREEAYEALKVLHPYIASNGVLINEHYLYIKQGSRSLWTELPEGLKFILYQLLIAAAVWFWWKGRRFGRAKILYEEAEPDENQYAKAVGSLYYRAGHWENLLLTYYDNMTGRIGKRYRIKIEPGTKYAHLLEGTPVHEAAETVENALQAQELERMRQMSRGRRRRQAKELILHMQEIENYLNTHK